MTEEVVTHPVEVGGDDPPSQPAVEDVDMTAMFDLKKKKKKKVRVKIMNDSGDNEICKSTG